MCKLSDPEIQIEIEIRIGTIEDEIILLYPTPMHYDYTDTNLNILIVILCCHSDQLNRILILIMFHSHSEDNHGDHDDRVRAPPLQSESVITPLPLFNDSMQSGRRTPPCFQRGLNQPALVLRNLNKNAFL